MQPVIMKEPASNSISPSSGFHTDSAP